ncbi:MAG: DUF3849 domain-containing protein [Clostridiales bacterium]|nr:DUF3849 domain-containing protein [Clostridiales bacterium]
MISIAKLVFAFSKNDIEKVQPIIDSVINQKVEADKKVETIKENTKKEKKLEKAKVENDTEETAPTITQADIDSVLSNGSGFKSGKYRIYHQFRKQEKSKVNADFLKKEYGSGSGSHAFSDGVIGWSSFDSKGLSITKYGNYDNPDVKMSWSQVEKQIKKLISEDRYFTDEDNTKYPEFLKSINAPQYEIDNFIKSVHQKFIQSKSKLSPDEKRDSLALRLSDFIRDLDGYEQGLLKEVSRTDLADISADEMEKHLGEPETVQQLLDFLKNVQGATSDVYSRSNAWYFRQELSQLHSMQYVCHTDDIVYIDSSKFEILEAENNNFILRNVEMPLDTRNLSFEELQKQLSGDKSNDIYKRVVTENSADDEQLSPKPSIDVKQMQVGSLDKISNARFITYQSFSQNIIDLFLQQGSNTENARMMIATEFMKQKTEDEIAESLKNIYHGGFGIQAGNRIISAWYDEDGINISSGRTARYKGDAQVITWNEAADRIGQLLKNGDFASNVELVEAPGFEKRQLAEKIVNLYRDLSDEGSKQNLFSTLKNSGLPVGFPESTDFLNEKLNNSEFRKALSSDFDEFKTAYKQNREVLRFHYHKVDSIDRDLNELELPRISFESNMTAVPNINGFITDDEINADLVGGSGFENGKSRIYDFFTEKHTSDEKAAFLRDEYGIGGHSHALSGAFGSWQEHNSKGLLYSKSGCEDVKLNWLQASKRINELIKNKQYISRKEKNVLDEKQIVEQKVNAEQHSKNDINISVPEEKIISFTPIYKNTGKYAAENGEMDLFRASNRENRRCREAIEKSITENFDGMHLDKNAVDKVVEQFGVERVSYLLAATIKAKKDYDKRFSNSNIKWADTINISFRSPDSFSEIINSHSAILDEFTKQFREGIEKDKEIEKPFKEKAFEDIAEDVKKTVEYSTPISKTVVEAETNQVKENTAENFHITDYDLGAGSPKEKYNRNIEAIKTLFKIENEGRQATPEEQEILSKYVGWGGQPEVFDSAKSNWHNEYEEVKSLLSDSEYRAAKSSTLNAHYTTPLVISSIYKVLESAGFTGGKILEPAMGIGNFFGLLPVSMKNSELYGVELDSITGRIAKQLYPNADIQVKGFEKTDFDSGFFDAAVGNVPFGNYRLYDEEFHDGELIHDFFFKKSLDKVRPGGIVAFVTSKGTLDKADTKVREYLAQRADLLGAIRLPNTAFKKNANTEVTADILFLKKRENLRDFEKDGKPEWTETTTTLDGLPINSYFVSHPQMVLGEMKEVTRRYGKETACLPFENKSLDELLEEAVSELGKDIAALDNKVIVDTVENNTVNKDENIKLKEIVLELNKPFEEQKKAIMQETEAVTENDEPVIEEAKPTVEKTEPIAEPPKKNIYPLNYRNFCYCNIDGDIYYRENKNMEKQDFSKKHIKNAEDRVKGMIEISGCLQELIRFQKENYEDEYIIKQQEKLNKLYEDFTEKYGLLSDKSNRSLFLNDDTYPLLQSLENINSKGELESKADIFTKRTIVPYVEIDSVDTAAEALAVSISEKAGVDIDFMARLCSKTNDEVINDLEGVIFKNPVTEKYETSDEYLSGNVREKLKTAEAAAKKDNSYNINVSFLKEAQPKDLNPEEISVQLGSTWVPTKYYEQFMYELLDTPYRCQSDRINAYSGDPFKSMGRGANSYIIAIDYNNYSATYAISNKENYKADKQNFKTVETYGTGRINAYKIIEDTLNMKTVKIVDYFEDVNGKMKAVPNEKETILAQEKQALIKSKFREWIFDDAERTADLCKIYNEKFNSVRPREYSGKHINFVGMNPEIVLKEHQKNAIAHTLYGGNTLLAHSVGAGKSATRS